MRALLAPVSMVLMALVMLAPARDVVWAADQPVPAATPGAGAPPSVRPAPAPSPQVSRQPGDDTDPDDTDIDDAVNETRSTDRPEQARARREAAARLRDANSIQAALRAELRVLGDATTCAQARYVAYRRSNIERGIVDQWYLVSQLWADSVLLSVPDPGRCADRREAVNRCHVDKGYIFLDRLWDGNTGGYYPRADVTGSNVENFVRYTDDNSLAGLALLATADTMERGPARQQYLHAARREAQFLMTSGLWDDTFGGGFWWNTNHGDTGEGKPAQSNALAALFFARLHRETGDDAYRTWSLRTLGWLDGVLYDSTRHLYRWSVSYADPGTRTGMVVHGRYFNYDQGIAIEAQLESARPRREAGRLARARDVGRAIHGAFWGQERGGYNLEAGIEQVYTSYAAWTSLGHLALHEVDGDPRWLEWARQNADALEAAVRVVDSARPDRHYHAYRHYRCVDQYAPGLRERTGAVGRRQDPRYQRPGVVSAPPGGPGAALVARPPAEVRVMAVSAPAGPVAPKVSSAPRRVLDLWYDGMAPTSHKCGSDPMRGVAVGATSAQHRAAIDAETPRRAMTGCPAHKTRSGAGASRTASAIDRQKTFCVRRPPRRGSGRWRQAQPCA